MMRWAAIVCLIVAAGASSRQVKDASADAQAAFERGRAAHNAGKTDEAVSLFERAVALDSTSSLYQMWLGYGYSRQLSSASVLRKPFIARRAGEAHNMAVRLDPTSIDAAEARLDFFLDAPAIVGGGIDKARAEAARLATLDAYRGGMATARIAERESSGQRPSGFISPQSICIRVTNQRRWRSRKSSGASVSLTCLRS